MPFDSALTKFFVAFLLCIIQGVTASEGLTETSTASPPKSETVNTHQVLDGQLVATPDNPRIQGRLSLEFRFHSSYLIGSTITYNWLYDSTRIDAVRDSRFNITDGGRKLTISPLTREDSGTYTCVYYFMRKRRPDIMIARASKKVQIRLPYGQTVHPSILSLQISPNPARIGDDVAVMCVTQHAVAHYFMVDDSFRFLQDKRFSEDSVTGVLYLRGVKQTDDGYNITCCLVRPGMSSLKHSQTLRVQSFPENPAIHITMETTNLELSWEQSVEEHLIKAIELQISGNGMKFLNRLPPTQRSVHLGRYYPHIAYTFLGKQATVQVKTILKSGLTYTATKNFFLPEGVTIRNVTASRLTASSLAVSWQVSPEDGRSLPASNYIIKLKSVACPHEPAWYSIKAGPSSRRVIVHNLSSRCTYTVKVTARTSSHLTFAKSLSTVTLVTPKTISPLPVSTVMERNTSAIITYSHITSESCRDIQILREMATRFERDISTSCQADLPNGYIKLRLLNMWTCNVKHVFPQAKISFTAVLTTVAQQSQRSAVDYLKVCFSKHDSLKQHFSWARICVTTNLLQCRDTNGWWRGKEGAHTTTKTSQTQNIPSHTNNQKTTVLSQTTRDPSFLQNENLNLQGKTTEQEGMTTIAWTFLGLLCFVIALLVFLLIFVIRYKLTRNRSP